MPRRTPALLGRVFEVAHVPRAPGAPLRPRRPGRARARGRRLFYTWQRQLFENAATIFDGPKTGASAREQELQARIAQLEAKLVKKDAVIAEISEEYVKLKKELGEP